MGAGRLARLSNAADILAGAEQGTTVCETPCVGGRRECVAAAFVGGEFYVEGWRHAEEGRECEEGEPEKREAGTSVDGGRHHPSDRGDASDSGRGGRSGLQHAGSHG